MSAQALHAARHRDARLQQQPAGRAARASESERQAVSRLLGVSPPSASRRASRREPLRALGRRSARPRQWPRSCTLANSETACRASSGTRTMAQHLAAGRSRRARVPCGRFLRAHARTTTAQPRAARRARHIAAFAASALRRDRPAPDLARTRRAAAAARSFCASSSGASSRITCCFIFRTRRRSRCGRSSRAFPGGATRRFCAPGSGAAPAIRWSMRACASCGPRLDAQPRAHGRRRRSS